MLTHIYLLLGCAIPIWCDVVLQTAMNKSDATKRSGPALQPTMLPFSGLVSSTLACPEADAMRATVDCVFLRPALRQLSRCLVVQLSVGVLDSLAAIYGKRYGRTKWPGTNKTVEGTLCAIAGTMAIAQATDSYICGGQAHWVETVVPTVVVALLEACTQQIDNLVLPVVCAILVLVTKHDEGGTTNAQYH